MTDQATAQPLTDQQLDEIAGRASRATPGPWGTYQYGGDSLIEIAADLEDTGCGYRARRTVCRFDEEPLDNDPAHREWTADEDWEQVQADAAYIAAMSPDVAAALLAEIRRLRAELEHLCGERDAFRDQRNSVFKTNERLLAEVQESDQARLRAENETRRVQREMRTKTLCTEADEIVAHCPDHGSRDGRWMDCHCAVADDMRRRAAPAVAAPVGAGDAAGSQA